MGGVGVLQMGERCVGATACGVVVSAATEIASSKSATALSVSDSSAADAVAATELPSGRSGSSVVLADSRLREGKVVELCGEIVGVRSSDVSSTTSCCGLMPIWVMPSSFKMLVKRSGKLSPSS